MIFLNTILDIVFPVNCLDCGSAGSELCIRCIAEIPAAERESAKWIFSIFDYRHPSIKKALWLLKYKGKKRFAKIFAKVMHGRILEELSELSVMENFHDAILVPIPLSRQRYKERGYNQAELICNELIKLDRKNNLRHGVDEKLNFSLKKNILVKPNDTEHQARIHNRGERLKNIVGSFSVKNTLENINKIKNRNIILIDDIITTGATLTEARKTLKQAGARKVIAFTVAH